MNSVELETSSSEWRFVQAHVSPADLVTGILVAKDKQPGVAIWYDEQQKTLYMSPSENVDKNKPAISIPSIEHTLLVLYYHPMKKLWMPRFIESKTHTIQKEDTLQVVGELGVNEGTYRLTPDVLFMSRGENFDTFTNPFKSTVNISLIDGNPEDITKKPLDHSDIPPHAVMGLTEEPVHQSPAPKLALYGGRPIEEVLARVKEGREKERKAQLKRATDALKPRSIPPLRDD